MNAKLWLCVLAGVLVMHISVLIIWDNIRAVQAPRPKPIEPTFTTATTTYTNERGEKVKELQEFTVRTEFAEPGVLEKLPPPPVNGAAH